MGSYTATNNLEPPPRRFDISDVLIKHVLGTSPCPLQVLLTYKGQDLAVLEVDSKWVPNKAKEAKLCYGTSSLEHPGVQMIASERGNYYLGGRVWGLDLPKR